jgi:hypothetical protein
MVHHAVNIAFWKYAVMNFLLQIFWLITQFYSAFSVITYLAERYGYVTRGRFVVWSVINESRFHSLRTCMFVHFHLWDFFVLSYAQGFCKFIYPFCMNSDIYFTSFIVRSVDVMRPVFSYIFVFSSKTFQFFLSCFLSLSNNLKPTTRTTNNISETFLPLSFSLILLLSATFQSQIPDEMAIHL